MVQEVSGISSQNRRIWASHYLEHINKEAVDGGDNVDVPMELSMLVVTRVDNGGLPKGYRSIGDWIVWWSMGWDSRILISDEVKKSGIGGDERKNQELGECEVGGYIENCEMEDSDVGENKTEETNTEESDQGKVTTFV